MIFIPLSSYVLYPLLGRLFELTPLRKVAIGLFVTVVSFAIPALVEQRINNGETPHIVWQIAAYVVITMAEVMVSITALEFSYTQAPRRMKSFVMAVYMLSVSIGNLFTAVVNTVIQRPDGTTRLEGAAYYWFFTGTMLATAVVFALWMRFYRGRTYIQGEEAEYA
jgi:POT family proton-dependent oligopeptide transporter